jgi:transcriptional regulator of met regulon
MLGNLAYCTREDVFISSSSLSPSRAALIILDANLFINVTILQDENSTRVQFQHSVHRFNSILIIWAFCLKTMHAQCIPTTYALRQQREVGPQKKKIANVPILCQFCDDFEP